MSVPLSAVVDTFDRPLKSLRLSVTDRCNLRCRYCMPEEVTFVDRHELLTFEEIARFVRMASSLGIDKVRLTGGEPLMRRGLERLVSMVHEMPAIRDVGLTTNGQMTHPVNQTDLADRPPAAHFRFNISHLSLG